MASAITTLLILLAFFSLSLQFTGISCSILIYPFHINRYLIRSYSKYYVPNEDVPSLASHPSAAMQWLNTNVVPFALSIKYIAVGNEIHPSDNKQASSVLRAMKNVLKALKLNKLRTIKVSTSIDTTLLINSYPPSNGQFNDTSYITPIVKFLTKNNSPLLVNIYTYFAYISNEQSIKLDYALFTSLGTVVTDLNNGKNYQNLFDAMVDSVYAALEKVGAPNTEIVVSETGWPSNGGDAATMKNAGTYYKNLINHVKQGTPLKPGQAIETYLFAMFDEDRKPGANTERNFGLFTPTKHPKYSFMDETESQHQSKESNKARPNPKYKVRQDKRNVIVSRRILGAFLSATISMLQQIEQQCQRIGLQGQSSMVIEN